MQIKMGAMSTKRARKAINFPRSEKQSANGRENVGIAKMREVRQNLKIASKAATALVAEEVAKAVTREVLDDVIGDINIPSVPQVGGLTQVFRRSNRRVKVTVLNNYRLILKPKL